MESILGVLSARANRSDECRETGLERTAAVKRQSSESREENPGGRSGEAGNIISYEEII